MSASAAAAAAASGAVAACHASLAQPLRSSYRDILTALRGESAASAAESSSDLVAASQGGLHAWCMHAIQTLTQVAPAVRRAASSAAGGVALVDGQADCALVLSFLASMLQLLQMQPELISGDDAATVAARNAMDADGGASAAVAVPASSSSGGRSLLPFLYANLFKYCLHLHEYEQYYELLVHMPASFECDGAADAGLALGDGLKLECLKRFLIELLRERRTHDLVTRFNWQFPWQPRGEQASASSAVVSGKSVGEEVEAMLYWNAQTNDIEAAESVSPSSAPFASAAAAVALASSPASAAAGGARVGGAGHYDLLYTFLLSRQRYLRAAQAMHDYFLRLEAEARVPGPHTPAVNFVEATVARLRKGRGRTMTHAGASSKRGGGGSGLDACDAAVTALTSHSEQSRIEQRQLTLDVVSSLLQRKLHALLLIRDALRQAARLVKSEEGDAHPDDRECFMLENDAAAAMTRLEEEQADVQRWRESKEKEQAEQQQLHGRSPLYKRSRNAAVDSAMGALDSAPASGLASRFELLSLRSVERRLELVLSQLDMLSALQQQLVQRPSAELPPLDALLDSPQYVAGSFALEQGMGGMRGAIVPVGSFGRHIGALLFLGLLDRAFHLVRVFFDVEVGAGAARRGALDSNPNKQQYELAAYFVFQQLAHRICHMRAALSGEAVETDDFDAAFPLRMDDSLMELRCAGVVSKSTLQHDGDTAAALALRDAEQVLQLHLSQLDSGATAFAFTLLVSEVYLASGAEIPLWMRDRIASFMDRAPGASVSEGNDAEQEEQPRGSLFQVRVASSIPTAHASSIASQPFLVFMRLLVSYGRFELLFALLSRYLDWLAAQSTAGLAVALERHVLADIFDAFLFVQDQAAELPRDDEDAAEVQAQVNLWVDTLRTKVQKLLGAAAAPSSAAAGQSQLSSRGFGSALPVSSTAGSTFGFGGSASRFGFGGADQAAAPASRFGGGFGASPLLPAGATPAPSQGAATAAASPFASFAPSASPFADDRSAAATPSKHPFGGLPPVNAVPSTASSGGFGMSFGGGFGGAATASPFSFSVAPTTTTSATASLIARASAF